MVSIDLNADLGEGGRFDEDLLKLVSSASVACGGHAGSDEIMRRTLQAAQRFGVRTGAHPGFADPENFGRLELNLPIREIVQQVNGQVRRILEIAGPFRQPISYIKLHGALYNMAARDAGLAAQLFKAMRGEFEPLPIMALAGSAQETAAEKLGIAYISEGFVDRSYQKNGTLVPRSQPGAVLHDPGAALAQAVRMIKHGEVIAIDGTHIPARVASICLHGDNAAAVQLATALRGGLTAAGIDIRAN